LWSNTFGVLSALEFANLGAFSMYDMFWPEMLKRAEFRVRARFVFVLGNCHF
jgi:hypothetical protein